MDEFDLDTPLIEMSSAMGQDQWTIRHAVSGVAVFGGTSSGKSTGSGKLLAINYLSAGMGGLILTVKPTEVDLWRSYCAMTGRTKDLIVIEPKALNRFNIIDHISCLESGELAATDNIVEIMTEVIQAGQTQHSGTGDSGFWLEQTQLLLTNSIDLCKLAYQRVSIQSIYAIIQTIPKGEDTAQDPDNRKKAFHKAFEAARVSVSRQIDEWAATLTQIETEQLQDDEAYESALLDAIPDARLLKFVDGYFIDEFIPLSEKTRSIVQISVSGLMFRLLREPFYSLFCRYPSTVTPEDCYEGKIVVINLPLKRYHKAGRDIQMIAKTLFFRAWEKRDVTLHPRPCFMWVDEAQLLLVESDAEFLTTARSSRIATVFLTQSLSNFYAAMGGQKAEYRVRSLCGNFGTKIFHANTDEATNEYSSKLIGDAFFEDQSESVTVAQNFSQTRGRSLKLERVVRPEQFVRLQTGGPKNNMRVEGYMHRQGECFANGHNHIKMSFNQNYQPQ
ncbi:type IV secretory system conjugative DNA transfer family protein [Spirosoma endophyticum]|uniref:Type IV secretory system Conjugative DNA transfer n=1 Tax=Spirosoma endophyticum TaxID=662367 RepID=A0A1I2GB30_9BACT|nr:type IV secretory system conjugative DNA transfer family protein [Spirosoma endophyticum]SFF14954.1 Type IV secretory system Conjugative DNA transfer [Spirosoma endophyticum]